MSDEPIYMLNALWFKKPGGEEKYRQYLAAAAPYLKAVGGEVDSSYVPQQSLIGEWDADLIFFVKYPSIKAFEQMIGSDEYKQILELRSAALEKSLLVRCTAS